MTAWRGVNEHRSAAPHSRLHDGIALGGLAAILLHLFLRCVIHAPARLSEWPLLIALAAGGLPLCYDILTQLLRREFGADVLAVLSVITATLLGEYLAGAVIVVMWASGAALEGYATRQASAVLRALAQRMPSTAHRRRGSDVVDVALEDVAVGDLLVVFPHEICPVDGDVIEGRGVMDEAYLTGEPFRIAKVPGSSVISGAVNGETALTIRAVRRAGDSRYATIAAVMQSSAQQRPRLRRLGDRLAAYYTPAVLGVAVVAWMLSGQARRFLAVLVIATPCPLLIAIPVAILGAISLAARRSIIVKNPAVLEQVEECSTVIFDKTGTLTYGEPRLSEQRCAPGLDPSEVLRLVASIERYSKHPLAHAIIAAANAAGLRLVEAAEISEKPGEGLRGIVAGRRMHVIGRHRIAAQPCADVEQLPPPADGLECVIIIDGRYAAVFQFRDELRAEGLPFIQHLGPSHRLHRVLVVSGDRAAAVRYLAEQVGIAHVHAEQSPEDKLAIVRRETRQAKTLFIGDGINDAPALMAATVGIAMGQHSDITSEAADVVVMESSLTAVDELLHVSRRMRTIALQSAVGGMAASVIGMGLAVAGYLPPVAGAVAQEIIDVLAVLNALRAALPPRRLSDFAREPRAPRSNLL